MTPPWTLRTGTFGSPGPLGSEKGPPGSERRVSYRLDERVRIAVLRLMAGQDLETPGTQFPSGAPRAERPAPVSAGSASSPSSAAAADIQEPPHRPTTEARPGPTGASGPEEASANDPDQSLPAFWAENLTLWPRGAPGVDAPEAGTSFDHLPRADRALALALGEAGRESHRNELRFDRFRWSTEFRVAEAPDGGCVSRLAATLEETVEVPAGEYGLGSRNPATCTAGPAEASDAPSRPVLRTAGFRIAAFLVTNYQYRVFLEQTGYRPWPAHWPVDSKGQGQPPRRLYWHPVVQVSWHDAVAFCAWRGGRLPSADEWELAACGPAHTRFPWGETFDRTRCNLEDSTVSGTTPVFRYRSGISAFGLWDAVGNVREWTSSRGANGKPMTLGGCWFDELADALPSARPTLRGEFRYPHVGFRIVLRSSLPRPPRQPKFSHEEHEVTAPIQPPRPCAPNDTVRDSSRQGHVEPESLR